MTNASSLDARIETLGVLPVIEIDESSQILPLAEALRRGGVDALEVTLRTDAALEAIRALTAARPDTLVGAGTVLTPEQADRAMEAGAVFIVTPGFNPRVVRHCVDKGYPVYPGVDNATGIELALEAGLSTVKFFPATALGGMPTLRSMAAPFKSRMRFIPLGGVSPANAGEYARSPLILAVGGTWIAKAELVRAGAFERIEANAREAVRVVHGLQIRSLGFAPPAAGGSELLRALADLGGCLGTAAQGAAGAERLGEIVLACNNPLRTTAWLSRSKGLTFRTETLEEGGCLRRSFVLEQVLGGFTVRLVAQTPAEDACNAM